MRYHFKQGLESIVYKCHKYKAQQLSNVNSGVQPKAVLPSIAGAQQDKLYNVVIQNYVAEH
jgi:hypothetical protein